MPSFSGAKKPNIVLILADDQDVSTLPHMEAVQELLVNKGTTFTEATHSTPLCCPSRATILRGQYVHNHGVRHNIPPSGGERTFRLEGHDRSTVATWLKSAGYRTAHFGKYLNAHNATYVPPGWERWVAKLGGAMRPSALDVDGREVVREDVETLDVAIADYALSHLSDITEEQQPFYVVVSFLSPHRPFLYEERYADAFADEPLPSPPNFNEADVSDKPSYVRERPRLTRNKIDNFTGRHRDRLRSLQTVDDAVRKIVALLQSSGKLDDTYLFYYTDHGLNLGQHRLSGKRAPYAQAWCFPLMVRGPGVPQGVERDELVLNTDLAPTLADLGGAEIPAFVDGRSIAPLLRGEEVPWREAALIEQWHDRREGQGGRTEVPTYKAVRTRDALYVEYETGERELYDLANDRYQLENLYHRPAYSALLADLQARLDALRNCTGKECRAAEG